MQKNPQLYDFSLSIVLKAQCGVHSQKQYLIKASDSWGEASHQAGPYKKIEKEKCDNFNDDHKCTGGEKAKHECDSSC